ncbi:hypothetical protein [Mycobacterium sp. EPa45]|nr:hypothetical protein [Mycobacterium sp. EPa45]
MNSRSVKIEHRSPIATVNPSNGELVHAFNPMSDQQVDHAVFDAHTP